MIDFQSAYASLTASHPAMVMPVPKVKRPTRPQLDLMLSTVHSIMPMTARAPQTNTTEGVR